MSSYENPRGRRKDSSRVKGIARENKKRKRQEAEARQALRDARTPEQQLTILAARPGQSARERERLS